MAGNLLEELHCLWYNLHRRVVKALDDAGVPVWLAVATVLAYGRHRAPIPWHALVEYGFHASRKRDVVKALTTAGLATNTRRGILRAWTTDGWPIRSTYGSRLLTSHRSQTWPWADLFAYEDEAGVGGYHNLLAPAFEKESGKAKVRLGHYSLGYFAGAKLLVPDKEEVQRVREEMPFCRFSPN